MTILPVGKCAFRKAAVTSSVEMELDGEAAAHDRRYRIMPGSRSVVATLP